MSDGRFSTKALLVLASIGDGERHGYAIKKDVERRTDGDVRLGSATLYRLLAQLLDEGLVEESDRRPAPELDDERRRYYRITPHGRRELAAALRRFERVLAAARARGRSAAQRA